jgi:sugar-phosphatase
MARRPALQRRPSCIGSAFPHEDSVLTQLVLSCRAVLFDLDGVLVDSEPVVVRTWNRWAAHHGLDIPDLIRHAHGRRSIETVREFAPSLDAEAEVRWLEAIELADANGLTLLPGAGPLFEGIPDGQRAVVTSGGHALAEFRLAAVGLPIPEVVVSARDVPCGKPAPDGYFLAANRLGFRPRDCVVIEDTPAGIAAGRSAGATVLAVTTTFSAPDLSQADVVVQSLTMVDSSVTGGNVRLVISAP